VQALRQGLDRLDLLGFNKLDLPGFDKLNLTVQGGSVYATCDCYAFCRIRRDNDEMESHRCRCPLRYAPGMLREAIPLAAISVM
jgi:hypothetical protein